MMSKIVFIQPSLEIRQSFGTLASAAAKEPPLGLCYLAAVVRRNNFEAEIIDMNILKLSYQQMTDLILSKKPKYIGVTSSTPAVYNAAKLAEMIKKKSPQTIVILGGAHISAVPEETMEKFPQFNIGVIGEGENTIVNLLNVLEHRKSLGEVKGIVFREDSRYYFTEKSTPIKNLDDLPFPAWDLLPLIANYFPAAYNINRLPSFFLITSRGCTYRCTFCDRSVFGDNYRSHSPKYILEMIKNLHYNYKVRDLAFVDDNFVFKRREKMELCEMIIEEELDLTWSCLARVDSVDFGLLKIMKKAGCWKIIFGIESGSQKILDKIKKGIILNEVQKAVELTKQVGIQVEGFFMMALPGETKETVRETINFARKLDLDDFRITFYTPFPGSQLYNDVVYYGIADFDWKKLHFYNNRPNFVPYGLNKKEFIFGNYKCFGTKLHR